MKFSGVSVTPGVETLSVPLKTPDPCVKLYVIARVFCMPLDSAALLLGIYFRFGHRDMYQVYFTVYPGEKLQPIGDWLNSGTSVPCSH